MLEEIDTKYLIVGILIFLAIIVLIYYNTKKEVQSYSSSVQYKYYPKPGENLQTYLGDMRKDVDNQTLYT